MAVVTSRNLKLRHRVFVNGRFLRGPITGTSRVAEEILSQWDERLGYDLDLRARFEFIVLRPKRRFRDIEFRNIVQKDVHWIGGKLWELIDLPLAARGGTLVNFANIAPITHRRSILYLHDAQMFMYPSSYRLIERLSHAPLMRLGGHTARRVITISDFSAKMLAENKVARPERVRVINNGADHILRAEPDQTVLARFGLSPQCYVLMFGSRFEYKNTRVVFESMRRLKPHSPRLAVIARADQKNRIGICADDAEFVTLVSDVSDGALRALYSNALVFVAPARTEGYPITPLEALNCGCPVITTSEGSMPEVLRDGVHYVHADDADGWAAAIREMSCEPARRISLIEEGGRIASTKTWAQAANSLLQEVERVVTT